MTAKGDAHLSVAFFVSEIVAWLRRYAPCRRPPSTLKDRIKKMKPLRRLNALGAELI